jgi:agarase
MAVDWPDVKVAGPTDAYAYRDGDDSTFTSWKNTNQKFVDLSGNKLGAYAFHAYEHDFTTVEEGQHETVYDAQFSHFNVWSKGRLPSFIDLWDNEHEIRWGDRRPFVMSEYGILGWDEVNYFTYIKSCNAMLVSMMDRPDIMDKMSVFILSMTRWDPSNRNAMFISDDDGKSWYKSTAYNYLHFWGDLNGDYLFSSSDSYHLMSRSFLDGNTLYLVLHNNYNSPFAVNLQESLPTGTSIVSAEVKKLYGEAGNLVFQDYTTVPDLTDVRLETEATAIVRLTLSNAPELPMEFEDSFYGDRVLEDIQADIDHTFTIAIPSGVNDEVSGGTLFFSLHKANGFSYNPEITVNGTAITNVPDITHSDGVVRSWKQFAVDIPAEALQEGDNTVQLRFPFAGGKITSVRLALVGDGKHYIEGTPLPDGGMQVEFPTLTGRNYRVWRSNNLMQAGNWESVTNFTGTGQVAIIEDSAASPQQFYKVEVSTP